MTEREGQMLSETAPCLSRVHHGKKRNAVCSKFANFQRSSMALNTVSTPASPLQHAAELRLNVGGKRLSTTLETLCLIPGSRLARMLGHGMSEANVGCDDEGRIFLDWDPALFQAVLRALRIAKEEQRTDAAFLSSLLDLSDPALVRFAVLLGVLPAQTLTRFHVPSSSFSSSSSSSSLSSSSSARPEFSWTSCTSGMVISPDKTTVTAMGRL